MAIRDDHRPWTAHDCQRIHELRSKGFSWARIGHYVGRNGENCRKRYAAWIGAASSVVVEIEDILDDDARHVTALLTAGGFGRLPLPWREPKLFVWRAA